VSDVYGREKLVDKLDRSFGLSRSEIERIVIETEAEVEEMMKNEQGYFDRKTWEGSRT